jgi:hypothetical protein
MSDPLTNESALVAAEAEVKRLRKRVQHWRGRVTAELNKLTRAEYVKATAPQSDEALMLCSVTMQNFRTMAANYEIVAGGFERRLRNAEVELKRLESGRQ